MPTADCRRSVNPDCIRTFDSIDKNLAIIRLNIENHLKHHETIEFEASKRTKWAQWIVPVLLSVINLIMILKIRVGG